MQTNNKNLTILFFTILIVMMGFGIILPILPFLIEKFGASGKAMGLLMASYAVAQFIFSPIWGKISDKYGRKPILIIGVFGFGLAMMLFGFATQLWMLFAARILAGVLSSATMPTAMAYIGDSTSDEDRGKGMGILGAAMGLGMVVGPGLGGWLSTDSFSIPFFVSAGISFFTVFLLILILPESLDHNLRATETKIKLSDQIKEMSRSLTGPIGFLLFLAFLISFGLTNFESVFGLYASHSFNYNAGQVGTILMVIGLISALVQGFFTGIASKKFGESNVVKFSLLFSGIGFLLMLQSKNLAEFLKTIVSFSSEAILFSSIIFTMGIFVTANAMIRPGVSSLISKRSNVGQGAAMGLNNSFMSLGRIFGPLLAGYTFDIHNNLPYTIGAIVMFLGFLFSIFFIDKKRTG
ncbi:MAG: MFS transporter [Candidatus Heimdallarchaeota archaeon]|nr:MFS transporter [Candidatus Heimdallarchaeota archaeon]